MKKKLLLVISSSILGGAQLYIVHLVEALNKEYEIIVLCPKGYLSEKIISLDYDTVNVIESEINILMVKKLRQNLNKLYKNINEEIIVNAHLLGSALYMYLSMPKKLKRRYIVTLHQPILYDGINFIKKLLYPFIIRKLSNQVDEYIAVSEEIKRSLAQYTSVCCTYITNTVPDIMPKKEIEDITKKDKIQVGIIGRLTFQKNQFCFIDAAKEICKIRTNVEFFIIGDGELKTKLEEYSEKTKMKEKIKFVGAVSNPYEWMRQLDILVFSSDFEGIPLTMLEAMSIGIPIVSTNVGGISQVITNGYNGILVKPRNPEQISTAVLSLINDKEKYYFLNKNCIFYMNNKLNYSDFICSYKRALEGKI